jgi:amino acid adenylation domain-containing protein
VFFRDFGELYHARLTGREPELPALAIQYADFAAWQRDLLTGGKLDRSLDFWRAELAGLDRPELPLDRPRPPVQTFEGDLLEFSLDATRADRVRRFSQRHGVTTFVTMLALVDTLLYRWGGLTDVVVGVGTSGRVNPATHDLIGYFNNLPPFRTRLEGSLRFTDLVRRCAATVAGVLDHEEIPFEKIVSAVCRRREPNRHPLFDVAYTYQNVPQDTAELAGLTCSRYLDGNIVGIAPGTAKFDLTVGVIDQQRGPMDGYLEYAVALFDRDTIMGLAQGLPALLDSALDDPERSLDGLDWPEGEDRPAVTVPGPVRLFEEWAARRPEQPAIRAADGRTLTYRELNRWANRLARRLAAAGVGPDVAVPVVAERGPGLVAGWLAVAKAGGAYVPIDPSVPAARVNELVAATDARIVLTDMELEFESTSDSDDEDPADVTAPAGLAYVAYTSGSTGPPQGCAIERRNLAHLVCWYRDTAGITEHDRLLQAVSPGFDATVLEIWAALGSGATLCFLPSIFTEPHELLHWLAEQRITVAFLPTPLAEVVLTDCRWPAGLRLRVLCTGGDRLRCRPPADTPFRVLNAYGPTECTVAASAGPVDPGSADVVPDIGRPITGAAVRLLDRQGRIVPSGQWGEIHIGGPTVGRGYHRNPGLTASRFVADPFAGRPGARMYRTGDLARSRPDGTLEFGGRLDDQVEVRGQRVEPAEIERALATHPRVRGALVVPSLAPSGSTRLVAHVTGDVTDPQELRAWAGDRLPGYLVPSDFVLRDSLPVTPNGKIDRRSLRTMPPPSPVASPVDSMQPRRAERVLTELCAELLGRQQVSARDNFFDLGGDSVLGVRVAARAAKAGVHFTPQQLLQCHTVGELAAVAVVEPETTGPVGAAARHVALDASDDVAKPIPLTPVIRSFLERMPDGATDFIEVHPLETVPEVRADTVRTAVQHLVAQHEPLRYRLRRNDLGTHIECHQVDLARVFDTRVLPPLSPDDEYDVIAADCQAMKSEIDVAHGPLIRVRHYDRGRTRGGLVVLLIHHFVFDNMSTVVLIDELDALLSDILAGKEPAEQPRAARWREWARHLTDMSVSDELAAELMYWTATLRAGSATGSFAGPQAGGLADRTIAPEQVAPVLAAGAAEGREAALSAVARGLARWRGTSCAYLMTEGDATPNAFRLAGRGPSFGWFTTLHPLVLPVEPGSTARDCIAEATERIRSVPNDGVGYGILRHLTPDSPAVARLRSLPEPEVMVVHAPSDTGGFDRGVRLLRTRWDLEVNLKQSVTAWFPVIVSTKVRDGALRLAVTSRRGVSQEDLDSLADEIVLAVTELART